MFRSVLKVTHNGSPLCLVRDLNNENLMIKNKRK